MKGYGFSIALVLVLLLDGCSKAPQLDQGWLAPISMTGSKAGLVDPVELYKWHDAIIMMQWLDDKSAKCFLMNRNSNSWSEVSLTGVPHGYIWTYPAIDQAGDRVFFEQGYMENDQLVMNVLVGRMSGSVAVRDVMEKKWLTDKKTLFGETGSNVQLNDPGKRNWPYLGLGIINNLDMYIPYCLDGRIVTYYGKGVTLEHGPFVNGVFYSADSGMTWQNERISDFEGSNPAMCKTKGYYYYFATGLISKLNRGFELWFSRKPVVGDPWDTPHALTKNFASGVYGQYVAKAEDNTVHVCWLDRRHNKWRFNLEGPNIENDDIVYCRRKDSDNSWSKDVILSNGLLYSYAPSMSVESNKVVAVWAGIPTAGKQHTENDPNDIYYATSNDGGNTWAKPLKVTDGVKGGITSGKPQVMLLNGVIHLFYIQGKRDLQELSPGLTKLNQASWPIYYQQRPFPN